MASLTSALQLLALVALPSVVAGTASAPTANVEVVTYLAPSDNPATPAPSDKEDAPDASNSWCGSGLDDVAGYSRQRGGGFVAPRPRAVLSPDHGALPPTDVRRSEPQSTYETRLPSNLGDESDGRIVDENIGMSSKSIVAFTALGSYIAVTLAAKLGILPGPIGPDASILPYADSLILRDLGSSLLCAGLGLAFVKAVSTLAAADVIEPKDSRKIIHTLSAPLFMTFWPLFSDAAGARYFAGVVPLANAVRLYVAATGSDEKELASAVSRSGDVKEALGGPFFYVLVLLAATVGFWRDDLVGIVAVSTMAAGDGLADLIGRRYGKTNKWFFNKDKSIAGSTAFFAGASLCSVALAWWLGHSGALALPLGFSDLSSRIVLISAICAIVELIPVVDDNWSVPLSAAVLSALLLH